MTMWDLHQTAKFLRVTPATLETMPDGPPYRRDRDARSWYQPADVIKWKRGHRWDRAASAPRQPSTAPPRSREDLIAIITEVLCEETISFSADEARRAAVGVLDRLKQAGVAMRAIR